MESIPDLDLSFPPSKLLKDGQTAYIKTLNRASNNTNRREVIIIRRRPFSFIYTWINRKAKQDPTRYGFLVEPSWGNTKTPTESWVPPYWRAYPFRDQKKDLRITQVSWSDTYHDRFNNLSLKKRLQKRVKEIEDGKRQLSLLT